MSALQDQLVAQVQLSNQITQLRNAHLLLISSHQQNAQGYAQQAAIQAAIIREQNIAQQQRQQIIAELNTRIQQIAADIEADRVKSTNRKNQMFALYNLLAKPDAELRQMAASQEEVTTFRQVLTPIAESNTSSEATAEQQINTVVTIKESAEPNYQYVCTGNDGGSGGGGTINNEM